MATQQKVSTPSKTESKGNASKSSVKEQKSGKSGQSSSNR
jgi:hypothetical protein